MRIARALLRAGAGAGPKRGLPRLGPRLFSTFSRPEVVAAGEGAVVIRFGTSIDTDVNKAALRLAKQLDREACVLECVPAYASVLVRYDPLRTPPTEMTALCQKLASLPPGAETDEGPGRLVRLNVAYGGAELGPDLANVAVLTGITEEEVVKRHSQAEYRVFFIGFTGGFPYLGGLDPLLATVPRMDRPRERIEAGSVAIAGGQAGLYPTASPGGWHIIGRTATPLFDPSKFPPALLRAGDRIQFVPTAHDSTTVVDALEDVPGEAASVDNTATSDAAKLTPSNFAEVESSGPLSTVQDLGRAGYGQHGVSRSGAADTLAVRTGNALLGNEAGAAALEVTFGGLRLRITSVCAVVVTGADAETTAGGRRLPPNEVRFLKSGDTLEMGVTVDGARAYLCVAGGIAGAQILGSRSVDTRAMFMKPLQAGDTLQQYPRDAKAPSLRAVRCPFDPLRTQWKGAKAGANKWSLRVLPGQGNLEKDAAADNSESAEESASRLVKGRFAVDPASDRMGVRLSWVESGAKMLRPKAGQTLSEGIPFGAVQLPPDGNPILLLAEHQATGGYRMPAVVIAADLWKVGQMRPGDFVELKLSTLEEAVSALQEQERLIKKSEPIIDGAVYHNLMGGFQEWAVQPKKLLRLVDLNADTGEGFDDAGLMRYITSANLACGGHVGSAAETAPVVAMAAKLGISIGAHVSFEDREGFGRRRLDTPPDVLRSQVLWQCSALMGLCREAGTQVRYIKPHGALYHAVLSGGPQSDAVVEAAGLLGLPLLLMPGFAVPANISEGFSERAYDGKRLRDRSLPGAVIDDPHEAAAQALHLAEEGLESICVHGDSPHAVAVAKAVREGLEAGGWQVRAPSIGPSIDF